MDHGWSYSFIGCDWCWLPYFALPAVLFLKKHHLIFQSDLLTFAEILNWLLRIQGSHFVLRSAYRCSAIYLGEVLIEWTQNELRFLQAKEILFRIKLSYCIRLKLESSLAGVGFIVKAFGLIRRFFKLLNMFHTCYRILVKFEDLLFLKISVEVSQMVSTSHIF